MPQHPPPHHGPRHSQMSDQWNSVDFLWYANHSDFGPKIPASDEEFKMDFRSKGTNLSKNILLCFSAKSNLLFDKWIVLNLSPFYSCLPIGSKGALPGPNSMNFRKTSEWGGGHFRSEKLCCAFSVKGKRYGHRFPGQKRNIFFRK